MEGTKITPKVRIKVLERDSIDGCPCCIRCGKPLLSGAHLHHVKRRSQGGLGEEENLVTLCYECHTRLHGGDKSLKEFCESYLGEKYESL